MIHKIFYSSYNNNTFTLRDYVGLDNIRNSLPIHNDLERNNPPLVNKISDIEFLYRSGKGLFAWDAGSNNFKNIAIDDFVVIIFSTIKEVFIGRLYYKFFDTSSNFQIRVNWQTDFGTKFKNVLLFDEGQYFTEIPIEFLELIKSNPIVSYEILRNTLDKNFVEISNIKHPIFLSSPSADEKYKSLMTYLYKDKKAIYNPRNLFTNNHNTRFFNSEELKIYLGTYFPRSLNQSYTIFKDIFNSNYLKGTFEIQNDINILDIGSGTGGNLIGLLLFLQEINKHNKKISILSIDGSEESLALEEEFIGKIFGFRNISLKKLHWDNINTKDEILEKLNKDLKEFKNNFDIVLSFKFVDELYRDTGDNFGLYRMLLTVIEPFLKDNGLILLADVTDIIFNNLFLSIQMSKEIQRYVVEYMGDLKVVLPLSCALYQTDNPYHSCFKQKIFRNTNIFYPNDKEKLCFFLLAKTAIQEKILAETKHSTRFLIAEKTDDYDICDCGRHLSFVSNNNAPDAFCLKNNLI